MRSTGKEITLLNGKGKTHKINDFLLKDFE
jgi:hypothetical protein